MRHRAFVRPLLLSASLCLAAGCRSGTPLAHPAAAAGYAEVPLVRERGYALVPVSIGALDSLWFVVDVAAGGTVISPATRDALGLSASSGRETRVLGAGGESQFQQVRIPELRVGHFARREVDANVIDLARFQRQDRSRTFAGLLGNDFLRDHDFVLDLPRSVLRLYRHQAVPGPGGPKLAGLSCVPNLAQDAGWVVIDIRVDGAPVRAIVDTGAGRSVFNWAAARAAGVSPGDPRLVRSPPTRGLGSQATETVRHTFSRVEAGRARLRVAQARIADLPVFAALGLDGRPAALLGTDYMEDRALTVSYGTRQVCFGHPVRRAGQT